MDIKKDNFYPSNDSKKQPINALVFGSGAYMGAFERNEVIPILKRTERIATALYLITECIDEDEALVGNLRSLSLDAVKEAHFLLVSGGVKRQSHEGRFEAHLLALRSIVSLGYSVGLISDMNGSILIKEISELVGYIETIRRNEEVHMQGVRLHSQARDPKITPDFFRYEEKEIEIPKRIIPDVKAMSFIPPTVKNPPLINKGQQSATMSFKGQNSEAVSNQVRFSSIKDKEKEVSSSKSDLALRIARRNTILRLIKDKREVTIKDISSVVSDISEKTIQRELLALVSEGVLKKTGEKRWSRYSLVSNSESK